MRWQTSNGSSFPPPKSNNQELQKVKGACIRETNIKTLGKLGGGKKKKVVVKGC